ncbi:MAG: hypothetical protein O2894_06730 [Planctomycetota bacterium]|nr:hypothetical protein [Planctomycetota bacterium]
MRYALAVGLALLLALGTSTPASAGDHDLAKMFERDSPWKGHGIGSVVHRRTTQDMKIPQMPGGGRKTVTEEKETLVQITETEYVLKVENKDDTGWRTSERRVPKVFRADQKRAKVVDAGEETVTIAGKDYTCQKKTLADMSPIIEGSSAAPKGRGGQAMPLGAGAVWAHDTLGVLKMQMTMSAMGQQMTNTMVVTNLSVARKVGDRTFDCREWTMTMSMGGTRVALEHPSVPGTTLLSTMTMSMQGFSMETREELLAYDKKPLGEAGGAEK